MARTGRKKSESGVYHVLLRGVDKLFLENSDYTEFKMRLGEYFSGDARLLAFLLLPNRVHLVIDVGEDDLSVAVKPLCTSYARYFNRTYSIGGKLFYDRFKSVPCHTASDIGDTVAFLNAVGSYFAEREQFSLAEYETRAEVCDTSRLVRIIGSDITSKKPVSLHLDDYTQLSKEDMNIYLGFTADCTLDDLTKANRQDDSFKRIFSGGVSARAVLPLFGVHTQPAVSKKPVEEKKTEPEPKAQEKKNLSVWLL